MTEIPLYMKNELSDYMLRKNPKYKDLFKKCPICGKNSLKPLGVNLIKNPSELKYANEWKCTICGYIRVRDLVVSTTSEKKDNVSSTVKEGRILEEFDNRK